MKYFLFGISMLALLFTGCAPTLHLSTLHLSAKNGDLSKVNSLLDSGTDVNQKTSNNNTALHYAADQGHLEMVKILLAKGAEVDPRDKFFQTPLFYAARKGHFEVVKVLLAHDADVNAKESTIGSFPLNEAIAKGHLEVAKELIAHGADLSAQNNDGYTPLHAVANNGYADLVGTILANGAELDPDPRNKFFQTPLFYAAGKGHLDVVKVLLAHDADVNARESTMGSFPLNEALFYGHLDVAKELIAHGANVSTHNNNRYTPLHAVANNGYADLVETILANGAELDPRDRYSYTPLFYAASKGHIDVVKLLLIYGADENIKCHGFTPQKIAEKKNHSLVVKVLQENDNLRSKSKILAVRKLHFAVRRNDLNQVKLLLKEGADLNAKNTDGMTALHLAAYYNLQEVGWALLDAGAKNDPFEKFPVITARAFNMTSEYYFSKNNSVKALEHFEIASKYSEKASLLIAKNSELFKVSNVTIGIIVGGAAGGLLGALTGDDDVMKAGIALGAIIGGGIGSHAEKKRLHFANEEARIEAIRAHINRENQRLTQYIALMRKYVDEIKIKIGQINQQYANDQKSLEDMQFELARIQKNREQIANSIAAFKAQKEKYQLLAENKRKKSSDDSVAVLDNCLKNLEIEIAKLEGDLDSLDEVLKLSKVG